MVAVLASENDDELDLMLKVLLDEDVDDDDDDDEFGVQMVTLMGADLPMRLAGVT